MASTSADLDSLNLAVDRIRRVIPPRPYLQSIPQDESPFRPDHHHYEAARVWRGRAPFGRDERPDLQYQTFFYQEHGASLIHLGVQSPPLESQRDQDISKDPTRPWTGTSATAAKKKISLADYKTQKSRAQVSDNEPGDRPLARRRTSTLAADPQGGRRAQSPPPAADTELTSPTTSFPLKRKRPPELHQVGSHPAQQSGRVSPLARVPAQRPRKQQRTDLPSPADDLRQRDGQTRTPKVGLPKSLSPLGNPMPGRLSPLGHILPERLSPDLPATIIRELDRRARLRTESDSQKSSDGAGRRVPTKHDSVMPHTRAGGMAAGSKISAKHQATGELRPSLAPLSGDSPDGHPARLIVRLRVPERLCHDLQDILRLPPRPADDISAGTDGTGGPGDPSRHARAVYPRSRHSPPLDTPGGHKRPKSRTTPPPTFIRSPPPAPTVFQSPPPPTPLSHRRVTSGTTTQTGPRDGSHPASTPATQTLPPSSTKPSPTSSISHRSTPTSAAWTSEANRLLALGKTLKQAGQSHMNKSSPELGLLVHIEASCAFVLSYHCTEQSQLTASPAPLHPSPSSIRATWVSLHAYWRYVHQHAARWPDLQWLVAALGQVYLTRILRWTPAAATAPEQNGRDQPTDPSAGENNGTGRIASSSSSFSSPSSSVAHEAVQLLSRLATAASSRPPVTATYLRDRWPETWRRAMDASRPPSSDKDGNRKGEEDGKRNRGRGTEKNGDGATSEDSGGGKEKYRNGDKDDKDGRVNSRAGEFAHNRPGHYTGPVDVFLGPHTPAVVAVRSVLSMLSEWRLDGGRGRRFEGTLEGI